ncbi:MAG: hypothetical protein KDI20_13390, partial [Pseudomonadales bacterium]|nr:hypothetical protein [Pseudomonadales bacterium]
MGKAYTFNGLGIDLEDFVSNEITSSISLDGKITNYYADIVGEYIGIHPGSKTEIFIENGGLFDDHSIAKLVKSLSVYRVLATLAPDLDTDAGLGTIYSILDAASNIPDQSLETIIDKLGDLLGGNLALSINKSDVELFYQEIVAQAKTYDIESIPGSIASFAYQDTDPGRGYRYALVNLLPFALTSNLAGTAADDLTYDADNFTSEYLTDRAQMLELLITRNTLDITTSDSLDENQEDALYIDQTTNLKLTTGAISLIGVTDTTDRIYFGDEGVNVTAIGNESHNGDDHLYGMGGEDTLHGGEGSDHIEGNADDDELYGDAGRDYLFGGAGEDKLYGGKGNDVLSGGA